jgi:outer membrane protein OmpA-like peptidoglycan-associated protein
VVERKRVSDALLADRQNARYSRKRLLRQAPQKIASDPKPVDDIKRSSSQIKSTSGLAEPKRRIGVLSNSQPSENVSVLNSSKGLSNRSNKQGRSVNLKAKPLIKRPNPRVSSYARVGNPIFGAPPSDIAVAKGEKVGPDIKNRLSAPPAVPGTQSPGSVYTKTRGATVRFASGSSALTKDARSVLRKIAEAYRQRGGALRIDGHASSRTRDMTMVQHHMVNFNISLKRSNAVARELIRQGVASEALFVSAISDSKPIYSEIMPAGDAGNQRVEIYFVN